MSLNGWKRLYSGMPWFRGPDRFPIAAYSEFIPPPRLGAKPYDEAPPPIDDPVGWSVTEMEEHRQLRPGLSFLAGCIVRALAHLGHGQPVCGLSRHKLADNPAWPPELAERTKAGGLPHERYVTLMPLALSRTLDDKGRLRWTLFGASEQGPARGFWRGFFTRPRTQAAPEMGEGFIRRLLQMAYGESEAKLADLRKAGFRILPLDDEGDGPLPSWTAPYLWAKGQPVRAVRYLLTFRPFATLPAAVRTAYLDGRLHLLPCPTSLLFWHVAAFQGFQEQFPFAQQVPLLHILKRHEALESIRVPQAGWMHEPRPGHAAPDDPQLALHTHYRRTHRWEKIHRDQNELAVTAEEDKLAHVIFSTAADDLGLYGKPMARNVQLWDRQFQLLLDGSNATTDEIHAAARRVHEGGLFGFRFQFPPMRVGRHEVYWHRPLVAYQPADGTDPVVLPDAPLGYLTAYPADRPDLAKPVEFWPRVKDRAPYREALDLFQHPRDPHPHVTSRDVVRLFDAWELRGRRPLPRLLARQILTRHHHGTVDEWVAQLPNLAADVERGRELVAAVSSLLEPMADEPASPPESRTFDRTARRSFEVNYWKTIATLAEGRYVNKSNADCVRDPKTQKHLVHHHRDLEQLGEYLLDRHEQSVKAAGMRGKALVGELPFVWKTDFRFDWMGGWLNNQEGLTYERDLIVVIPGRDRRRAVIMADHYDTAYMADRYDPAYGGDGARLAADGADDNYSATATLLLAAPIFLELSRKGQLGCDVWLIHLTGEEFPSDCLGARHLSQLLVEGRMKVRLRDGKERDLSRTSVQGLYVLDMVAHNNDHERDVFQIAPGTGGLSLWLAEQAHLAAEAWNAGTAVWNKRSGRRGLGRGRRSPFGGRVPETAAHLPLSGEVRLPSDPRSTLYNTDGQIFSDAGIPAVLFMENYDINRTGYHDTHDTMENIDLDYGAAVAAIAIESVARAACEESPE
jgi:hypothetical protein